MNFPVYRRSGSSMTPRKMPCYAQVWSPSCQTPQPACHRCCTGEIAPTPRSFPRRWEAMPQLKRAELMSAVSHGTVQVEVARG